MNTNENLPKPDFDDEEQDDNDEPDYYECLGCIKSFAKKPIWGQCPNCGSIVEEGYY